MKTYQSLVPGKFGLCSCVARNEFRLVKHLRWWPWPVRTGPAFFGVLDGDEVISREEAQWRKRRRIAQEPRAFSQREPEFFHQDRANASYQRVYERARATSTEELRRNQLRRKQEQDAQDERRRRARRERGQPFDSGWSFQPPGFTHTLPEPPPSPAPFRYGGGGNYAGAGATGTWDAPERCPAPEYSAPPPPPCDAPAPSSSSAD